MIFRGISQVIIAIILSVLLGPCLAIATDDPQEPTALTGGKLSQELVQLAPVVVDGFELFHVRGVQSYPAKKRAKDCASRIISIAANPAVKLDSLNIKEATATTQILSGKIVLVNISDTDAAFEGIERQLLAEARKYRIGKAIEGWRNDRDPSILKRNILFSLVVTFIFALGLWFGYMLHRRLQTKLKDQLDKKIHDVEIKKMKLISRSQLMRILTGFTNLVWSGIILVAGYLYLDNVFTLFPWTRGFVNGLFSLIGNPLRTLWQGVVESLPDLAFLLVLFFIVKYILTMFKLFFKSLNDGNTILSGFDAEWAWPTYRLVRLALFIFALVVAYPYIPGSSSAAFKGLSIFIGVLFSIGSSSFIGNLIAGYTMTYRRAFKVGQRIKIGNHFGDVETIRLMVTHLRTPKNEEVVIPNSVILNGEVINYSTLAKQRGLILHTTVGIGYETPWRQVEAMLIDAAKRTPGLLLDPPPFVLKKLLGDFCVIYEINVFCPDPLTMNRHYNELHSNILDIFNEFGVQIMTPSYKDDPEQPKLVPREDWYASPAQPLAEEV